MSPKFAAWLAGLSTYGLLFAAACLVRPVGEVFDAAVALTLLAGVVLVCVLTGVIAVLGAVLLVLEVLRAFVLGVCGALDLLARGAQLWRARTSTPPAQPHESPAQ